MSVILWILLGIFLIVAWPFALIWAVNTLFLLEIPFNFWTWLATLVLAALFAGKKK